MWRRMKYFDKLRKPMKKLFFRSATLAFVFAAVACAPRERTLVLLSTNDIHAQIDRFPQLAAAVEACRDTVANVVLLDAGDRWTGNPYVDRAQTPGMPIIRLMNRLGYDAATLGNHEFVLFLCPFCVISGGRTPVPDIREGRISRAVCSR